MRSLFETLPETARVGPLPPTIPVTGKRQQPSSSG